MPDRIHERALVGRKVQVTKQYHVKLKGLHEEGSFRVHGDFWRRGLAQEKTAVEARMRRISGAKLDS